MGGSPAFYQHTSVLPGSAAAPGQTWGYVVDNLDTQTFHFFRQSQVKIGKSSSIARPEAVRRRLSPDDGKSYNTFESWTRPRKALCEQAREHGIANRLRPSAFRLRLFHRSRAYHGHARNGVSLPERRHTCRPMLLRDDQNSLRHINITIADCGLNIAAFVFNPQFVYPSTPTTLSDW